MAGLASKIYREGHLGEVLTIDAIETVYGVTVHIHKSGGHPTITPLEPFTHMHE